MDTLRRAAPADAASCGRICFDAFGAINDAHGFPNDFPSAEIAAGFLGMLLKHPCFYGVVAERDGRIIGSNFLDERSAIAGVGPITVDPTAQNQGVGRRLMQNVMDRAASRSVAGVRLCQATFHRRSLCLYTTLGFRTREPLSVMNGEPLKRSIAGYHVRAAVLSDLAACNALCLDVHGFDRGGELKDAIGQQWSSAMVGSRVTQQRSASLLTPWPGAIPIWSRSSLRRRNSPAQDSYCQRATTKSSHGASQTACASCNRGP